MVAIERWQTSVGWYEVQTAHAAELAVVADIAHERVAALESACAPEATSEVARLHAGDQPISPLLAHAVAAALRLVEFSQGRVPVATVDPSTRGRWSPAPNSAQLELDRPHPRLRLPEGLRLDLWPIAQAWAADELAEQCSAAIGAGCLVNLGGDIAVRGTAPTHGWPVHIGDGHPTPSGSDTITLRSPGGLARASAAAPHWPAPPEDDPAPRRYWRTVTAASPRCERAKAACLTALSMTDDAPRWLTQRELPARLVHTGGIAIQTPGWPDAT